LSSFKTCSGLVRSAIFIADLTLIRDAVPTTVLEGENPLTISFLMEIRGNPDLLISGGDQGTDPVIILFIVHISSSLLRPFVGGKNSHLYYMKLLKTEVISFLC